MRGCIVTPDGEPKLLDFGIAKMLDVISDSTSTSIPMLTPDYASPEQVLGNQTSTSTDIYSLGAVLYKLLTGEPPHRFENACLRDVVAAIAWGKITPPSKLVPSIKSDLELIILKALRREPQERYLTVDQLSEDLENYLESRPIRARKGDTFYQLRKLLQRHWRAITVLFLVIASLFAGTLIARRQQAIAQQRFMQVRQLATRFIELHDDIARLPGSTKIRERMVATALEYLGGLSRNVGDDPQLLAQIGQVYSKIGQAQGGPSMANLGRANDALLSFRKAIQFERHAAALDPVFRLNLALFHADLAYLALLNGLFPEGQQNLDAASTLLDRLQWEKAADQDVSLLEAQIAGIRGDLSELEGSYDEELAYRQKAAALRYEYLRVRPSNTARLGAYRATTLVAWALADNGRYEEALTTLHEAAPVIKALVAEEPENPHYLRQEMAIFNYEGEINDNETGKCLKKPLQAAAALKRYVNLAKKLTDADPNNASARLSLASAYCKLSWPLGEINPPQSLHVAREAVRLFDEELARNPHDRVLREGRARAMRHLAYAYSRNGRSAEAIAAITQSIAVEEQLVAESPDDRHEHKELTISRSVLKTF
jgi:tetratricopeptide (TPR) repeat protein